MATALQVIKSDDGNAAEQPKKTAEQHAAQETVEKHALFKWVDKVAEKVLSEMAAIAEEILDRMKLDDFDDEEEDDVNEQKEREDNLIEKGVADGLKDHPEIAGAEIGHPEITGIKIQGKYKPKVLAKFVRKAVAELFKSDPTFGERIRKDVPGGNVKRYGGYRVSSLGVFGPLEDFEHGGGLTSLFSGGWKRIAKDRIDPVAWSHEFGPERKTETKNWLLHFVVTERNGSQSSLVIPRASLSAESGAPAIRLLMKAGVHVVVTKSAMRALAKFLRWKPKAELIRMPQPGWAEVDAHHIFVRSNRTILPPDMSKTKHTYILDDATNPDHYGHQIKGTAAEWVDELSGPLIGNSNVALALGTFFAGPLLYWADEQPGGFHLYGNSGIGKSLVGAIAQSVYGTPYVEGRPYAYGRSWEGTTTGFEYLAGLRSDAVLSLDELHRGKRNEVLPTIYKLTGGEKVRAAGPGRLQRQLGFRVLVFSTGEKSVAEFLGKKDDAEGRRRRLVDIPAEVRPGSAFETIPPHQLDVAAAKFYPAADRLHGAVGEAWQRHLVNLGSAEIKTRLAETREAWRALPEAAAIVHNAHPQVRSVVNPFALGAAALHMAIQAGLLPWSIADADAGILACLKRWAKQRGNLDTAGELLRGVRQLCAVITANLAHRFIHLRKDKGCFVPATEADKIKQGTPDEFDGYVKEDRILIHPEAWRRLCRGYDAGEVAEHLRREGALIPGDETKGELARVETLFGKTGRFYVLRRSSLP
jgi:uncharacterized protein (DUF927 family)